MMLDGLEDAYDAGRAMGTFAEDAAREYQFTREAQDEYAIESLSRANAAIQSGAFDRELTPVTVATRKGDVVVTTDEQPGKGNPDKIPELKAAFAKDGTITAATSSSISDGAAALVLTRAERRRPSRPDADRPHRRPRRPCAGARPSSPRPRSPR